MEDDNKDQTAFEPSRLWREEAEAGRIWIWGTLDENLGLPVLTYLNKYDQDENRKAIIVYINCRGGSADCVFAITDHIRAMKTGVVTVVHGVALSAGCIIAASGDRRLAFPHARFLFHGASQAITQQKSREVINGARELEIIDDMVCEHMAAVTKKRKAFWQKFVRNSEDVWFGVDEALEWGVIDEVCGRSQGRN